MDFAQIWNQVPDPEVILMPVAAILAAIVLGLLTYFVLFRILNRFASRTRTLADDAFVKHCSRSAKLFLPLLFVWLSLPFFKSDSSAFAFVSHLLEILVVVTLTMMLIDLTGVLQDIVLSHVRMDVEDNLRARKIWTQIDLLRKISVVVIVILGAAAILMSYDRLRQLGTGLLASAGVAGLIIGFAAQKTIANMLAGLQIAITQPIRIDDVVVVEGEWGRIEEITLTYVVVCIWDLRRLVLPISYFIEKPFQNWTRVSADILGTVFLYVDYSMPIEELRQELGRIVEGSDHWNHEVWRLHVTSATEKTVELRALMSAADSPTAWELRCEVREKLITFVQERFPDCLPRFRAELDPRGGNQ